MVVAKVNITAEDVISMMSCPIQFFTDYLTNNRFVEWFSAFRKIFPKGFIDHSAIILDVGGGTGAYACWLARLGYTVHLIDIVPLHVDWAKKISDLQPQAPLAGTTVGDARSLKWEDDQVDGVLLFGPMYHLTDRDDRLQALKEAWRVLKKDGILIAVGRKQ